MSFFTTHIFTSRIFMKKLFALILLMSVGAVECNEQAFLEAYNIDKDSVNISINDATSINNMRNSLTKIINNNSEILDYRHEEIENNLNLVQIAYLLKANVIIIAFLEKSKPFSREECYELHLALCAQEG